MSTHLANVSESYVTHAGHALHMAWVTAKITLALVVHAVLPDVFVTYGSAKIAEAYFYTLSRKKQ